MCPSLERDNEHFRPAVTPGYPTLCFAAGKHYSRTSSERDPGQNYRTNTKTSFMKNVTMPIITDTFQSQPGAPRATTFLINTDTKNQSRAEPSRTEMRADSPRPAAQDQQEQRQEQAEHQQQQRGHDPTSLRDSHRSATLRERAHTQIHAHITGSFQNKTHQLQFVFIDHMDATCDTQNTKL